MGCAERGSGGASLTAVDLFAVLGRRWTLAIMHSLAERPIHFLALQRTLPGIAHKVLTEHLRALEAAGIVERARCANHRVNYSLSDRGQQIEAVVRAFLVVVAQSNAARADALAGPRGRTVANDDPKQP